MSRRNRGREVSSQRRRPYVPVGTRDQVGVAYLYLFPFDFYLVGEAFEPVAIQVDGGVLRIWPPHENDPSRPPPPTPMKLQNIPRESGTTPPHIRAPFLESVELTTDGRKKARKCDGLRIDSTPDLGTPKVKEIMRHFVTEVRFVTRQWWIDRDRRDREDYVRHAFAINERGERLEGVMSLAKAYSGFQIERGVNQIVLRIAAQRVERGQRAPNSWASFLDAIYFHATADIPRSLLEAALTCEVAIMEAQAHAAARKGIEPGLLDGALFGTDLMRNLDEGLKRLLGVSFADDDPDASALVARLWKARGAVAHGRSPLDIGGETAHVPVDARIQGEYLGAVLKLLQWLDARLGR